MSNGHPLNDEDRWDWLIVLRQQALASLAAHATNTQLPAPTQHLNPDPSHAPASTSQPGVIVTCSALKQKYRDVLRIASYNASNVHVHFIYLKITEETSTQRALARKNHYMKANMVHSQFLALEEPTEAEWDVITVDTTGTQEEVMESALTQVKLLLE
jgi:gluconokinase